MLVLRHPVDRKLPRIQIARAFNVVVTWDSASKYWAHASHPSAELAAQSFSSQVKWLREAGCVSSGEEDSPPEVTSADLEQAIQADPDNPAPYLVYADWLQAQGDPRGELIAVHYALASTGHQDGSVLASPHRSSEKLRVADRRRLESRHNKLVRMHAERWLGPKDYVAGGRWLFGFLRSLDLQIHDTPSPAAHLLYVFRHPSARFVRELRLDLAIQHDWWMPQIVVDRLAKLDPKPLLAEIEIRSHSAARPANIEALCAAYPQLKRLDVSSPIQLGRERHSSLESLGLHPSSSLAQVDLPRLRQLRVHDAQTAVSLEPLLNGPVPASLREVRLDPIRLNRDLATAIANSRLLRQLESLELVGAFSEESISEVLRWRRLFRHLKRVSIKSAAVAAAPHLKAFKQLGPAVEIADS